MTYRTRTVRLEQGVAKALWRDQPGEEVIQSLADVLGVLAQRSHENRRQVIRTLLAFYGIRKEDL